MRWFAVRMFYSLPKGDAEGCDHRLIEEKITLYRANSEDEAIVLAVKRCKLYLELNPLFSQINGVEIFHIERDVLDLDGVEVWSYLKEV